MVFTFSSSISAPSLCSALAMADSSTLRMITAAFFCVNCKMFRAWSTFLPRIRSATRRPLSNDKRTPRRVARVSMVTSLFLYDFFVGRMALESTGKRKLTQLVANHLIGDIDWHVLFAVVHRDGQADEFGQDHGTARPGLNRLFVFGGDRLVGFGYQVMVNKRTFFERTSHLPAPYFLRRDTIMTCVRLLLRVR